MKIKGILICLIISFVLSACGSNSHKSATEETVEIVADGYDVLGGKLWEVGGLLYNNQVIDIKDNDGLLDLYDSISLSFNSDGTFFYSALFPHEGTYTPYKEGQEYDYYLLETERTLKFDMEKGEYVENKSGNNATYIIIILDENTIGYVEFDKVTGKAKEDEEPLIFVKEGTESSYIQNQKMDISQNDSNNKGDDCNSGIKFNEGQQIMNNSSYQNILDEYTKRMENAVDDLINEYNYESSGISDIETLAEINNEKIGELAEISNEGMGKMADLMYANNDSYDTYELWATKLMENYNTIAQEIMDAYLESAIN